MTNENRPSNVISSAFRAFVPWFWKRTIKSDNSQYSDLNYTGKRFSLCVGTFTNMRRTQQFRLFFVFFEVCEL